MRAAVGIVLLLQLPLAANAAGPNDVVVLPVQDRIGDPTAVVAIEANLRDALGKRARDASRQVMRDHLRKLRLRDLRQLTQPRLQALSNELGGDTFLVVTLLGLNRQPVPRVTLSAQLMRAGSSSLTRASFATATGADRPPWFGRRGITDWRTLVRQTVMKLVADTLSAPAERPAPERLEAHPASYRDPKLGPVAGLRVAVVPFDSTAPAGATIEALAATDLIKAALDRRGARLMLPGMVNEAMLRDQLLLSGAVRTQLRRSLPTDLFVTGTVEAWGYVAEGLEPQPEVGLALRVVRAETGRIVAMGSLFRNGWTNPGLFELGRIHGAGVLAERMMETLLDRLLPRSGGSDTTETP